MSLAQPFAIRLTAKQLDDLTAVSEADGLPRQEHIRRAIDFYLVAWRSRGQSEPSPAHDGRSRAPAANTQPAESRPVPNSTADVSPVPRSSVVSSHPLKVAWK